VTTSSAAAARSFSFVTSAPYWTNPPGAVEATKAGGISRMAPVAPGGGEGLGDPAPQSARTAGEQCDPAR
jgi:hypothetical protein